MLNDPSYIAKSTAVVVGLGVGMATTPAGATFSYWATNSVFGLLSGGSVTGPKSGVEFINPPFAHAPVDSNDYPLPNGLHDNFHGTDACIP